MDKKMKKIAGITLATALTVTTAFGITNLNEEVAAKKQEKTIVKSEKVNAKNIILLIGDGMGGTQVSAASYYQGHGYGANDLAMDTFQNTGVVRTFSHDNTVTDSAAAATAFSSTKKTDNGVIGQAPKKDVHEEDEKHLNVETVLESAEENGMATGLVSTARITHATPAAFASHVDDRNKENEIAKQMLLKHDIEVLLGGGKRQFLPESEGGKRKDGQNLLNIAKENGYTLPGNEAELVKTKEKKLLGLFNMSHMTYELDRNSTKEPSLQQMTEKAIKTLKDDPDGFFLMVEGGRIDHAGHANYPATNIHETLAFDKAIQEALAFAKKDGNTLVIVSADHETGGMSIGANGIYGFNKEAIKNVKHTPLHISEQFTKDFTNINEIMEKQAGIKTLKKEEKELITAAEDTASAVAQIISNRALIGWTTTGHTAVNVPVYAYGPHSEKLTGTIDNTDIAKVINTSITNSAK